MANQSESRSEHFFVGYLRVPTSIRWFLSVVVLVLLAGAAGFAFALYLNQDVPPKAGYKNQAKLSGVLQMDPHPMLHMPPSEQRPNGETIVLMRPGKFGVNEQKAAELDGKAVQVGGVYVTREDVRMFQVVGGGENQLRAADPTVVGSMPAQWSVPTGESLGQYRLKGEIVDSKCFLGLMKPGEGKVHKGCAMLCLLGGVPPFFVSDKPAGGFSFYLLADTEGKSVTDEVLRYVADPVEVTGEVERRGNLLVFKIDPSTIERL
ncbi:MAG: hypothetical protein OEU36_13215 [Gammaproteobacteria bacterium]|nr:hypothetical protein [Gammaproteobacteria bacterium]